MRVDERGSVQFDHERTDHGIEDSVLGVEKLAIFEVNQHTDETIDPKLGFKISPFFAENKSIHIPPVGHQTILNRSVQQILEPFINLKRVVKHFVHRRQLNDPQDGDDQHSDLPREY